MDEFLHVDKCRHKRGQTYQLLNPIWIIVRMPEPENLKIEDLSKSVKQAPHSEQATGHGMHCRYCLLHAVVQGNVHSLELSLLGTFAGTFLSTDEYSKEQKFQQMCRPTCA